MDPTTAAGTAVLAFKLALFALLIRASRRATIAVRKGEDARAAAPGTVLETPAAPLRDAA